MTDAELAEVRQRIGSAEPPTDAELEEWWEDLQSVDKVVLRALEGRFSALLAKPAKYTIEGDSSFDYSANLAALQKEVQGLRDETGAGGLTVGRLEATWER